MMHYHGGPITPTAAAMCAWQRRHAMISFAHPEQLPLAAEVAQSFALDNGAFSAWKSGVDVDWDKFLAWVHEWFQHPAFDFVLIPDVISGDEQDNDKMIRWWHTHSKCRSGVPVWHLHESLDRLDQLIRCFDRVALGSSGEYAEIGTDQWWLRMSDAMSIACDSDGRPRAKLHGLRMLNPTVFSHIPLSSADSTNIARNIGIDGAWARNSYAPKSKAMRAMVLAERIELHAAASRWSGKLGNQFNLELVG